MPALEVRAPQMRVAVDIGGTFTDLVAYDPGQTRVRFAKSLTSYGRLSDAVFACLEQAEIDLAEVRHFMHGSTIAINTVIQRSGARAGLITTRGFRHVYAIGRGDRPRAYDLLFDKPVPLVPADRIAEVDERMDARGEVVRALDDGSVIAAIDLLMEQKIESVAVVLLHAYRNPAHERRIGAMIAARAPGLHVTLGHEILREFREYERTSTAVLNAYVGPVVSDYVAELDARLRDQGFAGHFMIMQSNGGTMSAGLARARPVSMMESGPVAGVIGAARLGQALGISDVISFDMGGTTAKASLIEKGEARTVSFYHIGGAETGHPMMLPVVDIVEVGTGGGSIAWIDAAGGLKVGPLSAGAAPGPVCYGLGGEEPTITDANLVLGRLDPAHFLGGRMRLDVEAARRAIGTRIAGPLGLGIERAAFGIVRIADARMSLAVREVSLAKGHDPRDFALVASGGGGPLHAGAIARELSVPRVIVPELPGTFSALGMLMTDARHDLVRTRIADIGRIEPGEIAAVFAEMIAEATGLLARDGIGGQDWRIVPALDLRYLGQEYTLPVPLGDGAPDAAMLAGARARFDELHHARYRHAAPDEAVEIVNVRLTAFGKVAGDLAAFGDITARATARAVAPIGHRAVWFEDGSHACAVYRREDLPADAMIAGPAVIEESVSTTILHPGDRAVVSAQGALIIDIGAGR